MGKKGAPPAPDYDSLIPQQRQENRQDFNTVLAASRPNISTPTGTTSWTRKPGSVDQAAYSSALDAWKQRQSAATAQGNWQTQANGEGDPTQMWVPGGGGQDAGAMPTQDMYTGPESWEMQQSLSPGEQGVFDADQSNRLASQGKIGELLGNFDTSALDMSSLPPGYSQDPGRLDKISDALYQKSARYIEPEFQRQSQGLRDDLLSQGFNFTDNAVQNPISRLRDDQNQARADWADRATLASGAEDSRLFGQSEGMRASRLAEMLTGRNNQLQMLSTLRGGAAPNSDFGQAQYASPGLEGTDRLGLASTDYNNRIEGNNADNASKSQMIAAMMKIIGGFV